jgi:NAD(P)-dependent dehydrogenase (short-subunit alcohol dehydrogenase family)
MKTIFITGTSSGIGRSTANYLLKGVDVVATMRSLKKKRN